MLIGYLDPTGNRGFCSSSFFPSLSFEGRGDGLEEFPALPDLTIPRLGGIMDSLKQRIDHLDGRRDIIATQLIYRGDGPID
jgi:hypothetical protein